MGTCIISCDDDQVDLFLFRGPTRETAVVKVEGRLFEKKTKKNRERDKIR